MTKIIPVFLTLLMIAHSLTAAADSNPQISYQYGIEPKTSSVVGLKITKISDSILTIEHLTYIKDLDCGIYYLDLADINISGKILTQLKGVFKELKQIRVKGEESNFQKIFKSESEQLKTQGVTVIFEDFNLAPAPEENIIPIEWIHDASIQTSPRKKYVLTQCGCSLL